MPVRMASERESSSPSRPRGAASTLPVQLPISATTMPCAVPSARNNFTDRPAGCVASVIDRLPREPPGQIKPEGGEQIPIWDNPVLGSACRAHGPPLEQDDPLSCSFFVLCVVVCGVLVGWALAVGGCC